MWCPPAPRSATTPSARSSTAPSPPPAPTPTTTPSWSRTAASTARRAAWVLTPLVLADGSAVVVNRGFVGFDQEGEIVPPPAPEGRGGRWRGCSSRASAEAGSGPPIPGRHARRARPRRPGAGGAAGRLRPAARLPPAGDAATPRRSWRAGRRSWWPSGCRNRRRDRTSPTRCSGSSSRRSRWSGYALLLRRVARDEAREEAGRAADADFDRELEELLEAER